MVYRNISIKQNARYTKQQHGLFDCKWEDLRYAKREDDFEFDAGPEPQWLSKYLVLRCAIYEDGKI